jgi:hypothetical protein
MVLMVTLLITASMLFANFAIGSIAVMGGTNAETLQVDKHTIYVYFWNKELNQIERTQCPENTKVVTHEDCDFNKLVIPEKELIELYKKYKSTTLSYELDREITNLNLKLEANESFMECEGPNCILDSQAEILKKQLDAVRIKYDKAQLFEDILSSDAIVVEAFKNSSGKFINPQLEYYVNYIDFLDAVFEKHFYAKRDEEKEKPDTKSEETTKQLIYTCVAGYTGYEYYVYTNYRKRKRCVLTGRFLGYEQEGAHRPKDRSISATASTLTEAIDKALKLCSRCDDCRILYCVDPHGKKTEY